MGKTLTKTDIQKQQSYLADHPWFCEPYETVIRLSEEMSDLIPKPNFTRKYPVSAGDFLDDCQADQDCYIPHTYFDFMSLIGEFDCGNVHLYTEDFEPYTAAQEDGENGSIKILLGECDHGLYIFDTENDSYFLEGYDRTMPFVNCIAMLLHAIDRARINN
jgi:hypothetical protein